MYISQGGGATAFTYVIYMKVMHEIEQCQQIVSDCVRVLWTKE